MSDHGGSHFYCRPCAPHPQRTAGKLPNQELLGMTSLVRESTELCWSCALQMNVVESKAGYQMEMALPGISAGTAMGTMANQWVHIYFTLELLY